MYPAICIGLMILGVSIDIMSKNMWQSLLSMILFSIGFVLYFIYIAKEANRIPSTYIIILLQLIFHRFKLLMLTIAVIMLLCLKLGIRKDDLLYPLNLFGLITVPSNRTNLHGTDQETESKTQCKELPSEAVQQLSEVVIVIKGDYSITFASKNIFGKTMEKTNVLELIESESVRNEMKKRVDNVFKNHCKETFIWIHEKDGSEKSFFLTTIYPVDKDSAFIIIEDITKQKYFERLSENKSYFLSNWSHEMRNLLNSVIGNLELLKGVNLQKEHLEFLKSAYSSAEQLKLLADDIVDIAKLESGTGVLHVKEMNIVDVVERCAHGLYVNAQEKNLKVYVNIHPDIPSKWLGDELRISQILINFTTNAVKYTEKGCIILSAECTHNEKEKETTLWLKCKDTGIGIKKEELSTIFSRFHQIIQKNGKKGSGWGLGLSIVKQLAKLMGNAEVGVSSEYGKGSEFFLKMTLEDEEIRNFPPLKEVLPKSEYKNVLIVSQSNIFTEILSNQLYGFGVEHIKIASNEEELWESLKEIDDDWAVIIEDEMIEAIPERVLESLPRVIIPTSKPKENVPHNTITLSIPVKVFPLAQSLTRGANILYQEIKSLPHLYNVEHFTILVVEDNPTNLKVMQNLLEKMGIEKNNIETATNGKIALEILESREEPFSLIFVDLVMPELDGFELAQKIRRLSNERHAITPLVAVTGNAHPNVLQRCLACGINKVLIKPIQRTELENLIKHYVEKTNKISKKI